MFKLPAEAGPYKWGEAAVIQILGQAGVGSQKKTKFRPFASVWSKNKTGPPLDPPLIPDRFNFHRGATISYQL